jgi:ABC-type uncharacterized transport system substrate-binding protein
MRTFSVVMASGGKRLALLKAVVPNASRVAVLYNPGDRSDLLMLKELQNAAIVACRKIQ